MTEESKIRDLYDYLFLFRVIGGKVSLNKDDIELLLDALMELDT